MEVVVVVEEGEALLLVRMVMMSYLSQLMTTLIVIRFGSPFLLHGQP